MINIAGLTRSGYHLQDRADGVTLVIRDDSNACVGRVRPARSDAGNDLWAAELGRIRVMKPYASREAAIAAVCAYADKNPQLAIEP
jgi:hypothetical protein